MVKPPPRARAHVAVAFAEVMSFDQEFALAARCPTCNVPLTVEESARSRCPVCGGDLGGRAEPRSSSSSWEEPPRRTAEKVAEEPLAPLPRGDDRDRDRDRDWDRDRDRGRRDWDDRDDYRRYREPMPETLPGQGLTYATLVLIAFCLLMDLVSLAVSGLVVLPRVGDKRLGNANDPFGKPGAATPPDPDLVLVGLLDCSRLMVLLPAGIVFLCWTYRAYKNLNLFRMAGLQYSPGWAVGYFFIPIVNLFRPCQVFQEMWRASDPTVTRPGDYDWNRSGNSALIGFWWAAWIIAGLSAYGSSFASMNPNSRISEVVALSMVPLALHTLAGVLILAVVWGLRARQEAKFQAITRGGAPEDRGD
jgi:hypothetical protein